MPTPAAVGEVYQVRIEGREDGQDVFNVLHFVSEAAQSDVETTLLLVVLGCFIQNILPVLSANYSFVRILGKRVSPTVGPDLIVLDPANTTSNQTSDPSPNFCAGLISIRTIRAGRSGRGRIFIGAIPEGDTNGNMLVQTGQYWQALVAFCACIVTNFHAHDVPQPGNWNFGVMSRKLGGAKPPFASAGFAGISNNPNPGALVPVQLIATMRSRKVGKGS